MKLQVTKYNMKNYQESSNKSKNNSKNTALKLLTLIQSIIKP